MPPGRAWGQHLIAHLPLISYARAHVLVGHLRKNVGPGEHLVDVIDELRKRL